MEATYCRRAILLVRRFLQIYDAFRRWFSTPYFGFVKGHSYLSGEELKQIRMLVDASEPGIVLDFEEQFAKLVGSGECISYAAARMGFYELMRLRGISEGDEVILLGATCVVMVNAVMRAGATPIYADIDPDTFGSSSQAIAACITPRTRMIVAQHSFGIPCDIIPIVNLAKEKQIFLLEDCALTLGSKVNGIAVGNFGDAALFSTDHSKPLNTLTGGLIYTRNTDLAQRLRASQAHCADLSAARQNALWQRLLLEVKYCVPARYGRMGLVNLFSSVKKKITHAEGDFLADDFGAAAAGAYPYPAKLPAFLAAVGLIEANRWPKVSTDRTITLHRLVDTLSQCPSGSYLPAAYKNKVLEIVPLRFAWSEPRGGDIRRSIQHFIHVAWTWFMAPIIATKEPLEKFGYCSGACPISERIGPNMVNIPCIFDEDDSDKLMSYLQRLTK